MIHALHFSARRFASITDISITFREWVRTPIALSSFKKVLSSVACTNQALLGILQSLFCRTTSSPHVIASSPEPASVLLAPHYVPKGRHLDVSLATSRSPNRMEPLRSPSPQGRCGDSFARKPSGSRQVEDANGIFFVQAECESLPENQSSMVPHSSSAICAMYSSALVPSLLPAH